MIPSLCGMEDEIGMEFIITIKQEEPTVSPALLHFIPKVEDEVQEVSPVIAAATAAISSKRVRKPTRLKYYAEFLCDEVSSDAEVKYSNSEEFASNTPSKKTRIVLKETDIAKPFACDQCSQSYDTQHYLNRHIRTAHNPDRPYSCYLCKQSFKEKHHCVEHVKRHGDVRVYCSECSKPFKRNPELTRHLRDIHHIEN